MTPAEKKLWFNYLRGHQIRFSRQKPLDHFIADFFCASAKLVIEVDGDSHFSEQGSAYDQERTVILRSYGLRVIRFTNQEVMQDFGNVCMKNEVALGLSAAGIAQNPPTPL